MTQTIAKLTRWTVMTLGTVAFLWLMPWSFLAGNLLARVDLARGHAQMLLSDPMDPWSDCAATALHQSNGIEMQSRALCSISSAEAHFDQGYNAIMHRAMKTYAGRGAHDRSAPRAGLDGNRDHPHPRQ